VELVGTRPTTNDKPAAVVAPSGDGSGPPPPPPRLTGYGGDRDRAFSVPAAHGYVLPGHVAPWTAVIAELLYPAGS